LQANVAACRAQDRTQILAVNALSVPAGHANSVVFLDPPYGLDLVSRALTRLRAVGRIGPGTLVVAETGGAETWVPDQPLLAERRHGAARILIFHAG
jgi:16S rRNA (guanine966-N2)-methyltransferase